MSLNCLDIQCLLYQMSVLGIPRPRQAIIAYISPVRPFALELDPLLRSSACLVVAAAAAAAVADLDQLKKEKENQG